jgi:sRNA-binding protein
MNVELTPEQLSQAKAILTVFQEKFPKAFPREATEIRPLKINIHCDLYAVFAEQYSKKAISRALKIYTRCPDYFNVLTLGAQRIDLEGNISGEVTSEHLEIAEDAKERQQRRLARQEEAQKQRELEQEEKRRKEEEAKSPLQEKVKSTTTGRLKLGLKKKEGVNPALKIRIERTVQENSAEQSTRKRLPLSRISKKQLEQRRKEKELSQLPFGKMEVRVKIETLPSEVKVVKRGWQRFSVRDDTCFVSITVRPRTWRKLQEAPTRYPYWVANITGKMGQRLNKGKGEGFELLDPITQIFERKPTLEELEKSPAQSDLKIDDNASES